MRLNTASLIKPQNCQADQQRSEAPDTRRSTVTHAEDSAMSTATMSSSQTRSLPAPCEHKAQTGCMLAALPCCCSCADKRPHATAYPVYIDGQGMKMQGKRWQRYCRRCHGRFLNTPPLFFSFCSASICLVNIFDHRYNALLIFDKIFGNFNYHRLRLALKHPLNSQLQLQQDSQPRHLPCPNH